MKLPILAAVALAISATPMGAQSQERPPKWLEGLEKRFPPGKRNAAAKELESLAQVLGMRRPPGREVAPEAEQALDAFQRADFGSWLNAQIKAPDDSIAPATPKMEEFLRKRRAIVSRLVSLLVREVPDWGFDARLPLERWVPDARTVMGINRLLLSVALAEEGRGRHAKVGEYLEASWSLSQSFADRPDLLSLVFAVAIWRPQVGVLRKMSEPPVQWFERLSSDAPRLQLRTVLENDYLIAHAATPDASASDTVERLSAGYRVLTDLLLEFSPCSLSKLSRDEISKRVLAVFNVETPEKELTEEVDEPSSRPEQREADLQRAAGVHMEIAAPGAIDTLRRVERLMVDRELSLRVLELRREKAASGNRRWPSSLVDPPSRVCPEASLDYEQRGGGMKIRFLGYVGDAEASGLVLPLSFEARPPERAPAPAHAPTPKRNRRPSATQTPD